MKNICLIFFLLIFSISSFAQQTFEGTIINKQTKAPIPYITIKLTKEKIATAADDKGEFKLTSNKSQLNDTLLFSGVGYKSLKIVAQDFVNKTKIELEDDAVFLNEIKVSSEKRKKKHSVLNNFNASRLTFPTRLFCLIHQAAITLYSPEPFGKLKRVIINRLIDISNRNTNNEARFRLHIYTIDPATGGPGEDIVHQIITIYDKDNSEIKVDLEKYDIVIPETVFFVAIEWLYIPLNETILSSYGEANHLMYQPRVFNMKEDKSDKKTRTWYKLTPNSTWEDVTKQNYNDYNIITISAIIEN
ncbi:hypothetical protein GCM10023149_31290 [Mucilaginibacter gynuensis]|uniref:Carboxypeptidase-like protein n=1 Tax=Mucilaginibacter gynuensis TaxID=1302236 RepID=A0ABP8GPA9_9SPHI